MRLWGVLQRVRAGAVAWAMRKAMGTSGSETLSAAANIFMGQTEAPLVIRPYVPRMTRSEIMTIMVCRMAHIAGGVAAVYAARAWKAGYQNTARAFAVGFGPELSRRPDDRKNHAARNRAE